MSTLQGLLVSTSARAGAGWREVWGTRRARVLLGSSGLAGFLLLSALLAPGVALATSPQTITFTSFPTAKTYGDAPFTISAISDAGMPVSFSSSGGCSVGNTNGTATVTINYVGLCTINAEAPGNAQLDWGLETRSFRTMGAQHIVFANASRVEVGQTVLLGAFAADYFEVATGLPLQFWSSPAATCYVNEVDGVFWLHGVAAGTCTVGALQSGITGAWYSVTAYQTITIAHRAQTITFTSFPASKTYGDAPFTISATSDAGMPVSFSSSGSCSVDSGPYVATVTINYVGQCTIVAAAPGNDQLDGGLATRSFSIKGIQHIEFRSPQSSQMHALETVSLTAVSLDYKDNETYSPVQFSAGPADVCSVSQYNGSYYLRAIAFGSCIVTAQQAGNALWTPVTSAEVITVVKNAQTINYPIEIPDKTSPFKLSDYFSSSSGLQVSFEARGGWCTVYTVSGVTWVYPTNALFGTCYITASVPENNQYLAAAPVNVTFNFGVLGPRIRDKALGDVGKHCGAFGFCYGNWCSLYARAVWRSQSVDTSGIDSYARTFWDPYGTNHGHDELPSVGDAVLYYGFDENKEQYIGHVAIVTKVNPDGTFESVGGNQGGNNYKDSWVAFNPVGFLAGWAGIQGYVPPFTGQSAALTDVTYPLQTGQTASGSFTVVSTVGSSSGINMLVGPFFSDVDLQLYRPDGSLVSSGDFGVTLTKSANSVEVSIQGADPGVWHYQVVANELDPGGENIRVWANSPVVPTTVLTQDSDSTQYLQPVSFTATVMSPVAGGSTPTGSVQFMLDGSPVGDPVALDAAGEATWTTNGLSVASHTVSVDYLGPADFIARSSAPITHLVIKADQTIVFNAPADKTYGDPDFTVGATASSDLTVTFGASGDCSVIGTTVHIVDAGSCTITASQAGDGNYNPAPDVVRTFSIAKKALTVTASDATKFYGKTLSFAGTEFSVAGLVPGDGVTSVTLTSAGQPAGAQPGSYDIAISGALGTRLHNYVISYVKGTLTVNLVAIVGLDSVTLNGSGLVDSYNGAAGPYGSVPHDSGAFVVSNGSITVKGSAAIRGDIRSTQGSVSLTNSTVVTGNVFAGTTISTTSPIRGLASPNSPVPALIAPAVAACSPYSSAAGLSGSYTYDPATGDLSVSGSKTVTIASGSYCFGSITLSGSSKLVVSGPVTVRLTGKFSASGSSMTNLAGNAASLQISTSYAGNDGVVISGSGIAHFTVYAPAAQVVISGSPEIDGLILGKSVTVSGSAAIHQDTSATSAWAGYYRN